MVRSINKNHGQMDFGPAAYEIIGTARINGDKIRVERWYEGNKITGWNATQGRSATQEEIDAVLAK